MIIRSKKPMQRVYVTPTDNDVLCGRGINNFKHPGNKSLRSKIVAKLDGYVLCSRRGEKTNIIRGVIADVNNQGGRFLKYDYTAKRWFDGGSEAAKTRVGVAFRDAKIPNKVKYIEGLKANLLARGSSAETRGEDTSIEPTIGSDRPSPVPSVAATLPSVVDSSITNQMLLVVPPSRRTRRSHRREKSSSMLRPQQVALQHSNINDIETQTLPSDASGSEHDVDGVATAAAAAATSLLHNLPDIRGTKQDEDEEESHGSAYSSESIFSDDLLDSIEGIDDQFPKWESVDD